MTDFPKLHRIIIFASGDDLAEFINWVVDRLAPLEIVEFTGKLGELLAVEFELWRDEKDGITEGEAA